MIQRDDFAVLRNSHRVAEMRCFVITNLRRGAKHGLPGAPRIVRGPDHVAGAPIHVLRRFRIDGELSIVRDDLLSRHDTALDIGGHLPPGDSRILRTKQAAEVGHGPDFFWVRWMRDDIFNPTAAARAEGLPGFSSER